MIRLAETAERGMINLTILVTTKCTLNCKLCATYTPLQENPQHFSCEKIKKAFKKFIDSVDKPIGLVSLSGGEPFLHPQLPELIKYIQQYEDRIEMLEIFTNGTIMPSPELLDVLQNFSKANPMVDDYGPEKSVNAEEICNAFKERGITYRHRKYNMEEAHCGGWIDVSDFSPKDRSPEEIQDIFNQCAFTTLYSNIAIMIDGVAHMCYANRKLLPFVDDKPDESVDLLDDSIDNEEIRKRIYNLRNRKHLLACNNCCGYLLSSEHKKPATQSL